uniref:(northern house mosquito) hypothetical protein n=1 Tax=Culex pipiens TaxID=7175 RepID=A0A8D8KP06_CULPI
MNAGYNWMPWSAHQGNPPAGVYAGNDQDGSPIFVGRAFHEGDQLPAKVLPSKQAAYVSHNGCEIFKSHFEVLSGTGFTWVHSSNGHVPAGAVLCGNTTTGEPLYIGRAHHEGSLTPGKIHRSHGCLYIPFGGAEQSILHYEVLVGQQRYSEVSKKTRLHELRLRLRLQQQLPYNIQHLLNSTPTQPTPTLTLTPGPKKKPDSIDSCFNSDQRTTK